VTLSIPQTLHFSPEQFYEICAANPDAILELTAQGDLEEMSPTGWECGRRNAELLLQLGLWNKQQQLGVVFDSSTGFQLPNGAVRSPDAAWVTQARLASIPDQDDRFLPLCPEFVVELVSKSDSLPRLRQKLSEYIDNGTRLGWLIVPAEQRVEIYRPETPVEHLSYPLQLSGEAVLPDFVLNLQYIWA
jgi:Uma2 family endonuclease